jgi:hypothetical protein
VAARVQVLRQLLVDGAAALVLAPVIQEITTRPMASGSTPGSVLNLWSSVAIRACAKYAGTGGPG